MMFRWLHRRLPLILFAIAFLGVVMISMFAEKIDEVNLVSGVQRSLVSRPTIVPEPKTRAKDHPEHLSSTHNDPPVNKSPGNNTWLKVRYVKDTEEVMPPESRPDLDYDICQHKCGRWITMVNNHGARFGHYFETWRGGLNIASLVNLPYIHHEFAPKNDISARVWDEFLGVSQYFEDYSSLCVKQEMKAFSTHGYLSEHCLQFHPCLNVVHVPMMEHKTIEMINNTLAPLIAQHPGCNVVFHLAVDQQANFDIASEQFPLGTTQFIKDAYLDARKQHPIRCLYDTSVLNIGVHIRRGDVSETQNTVGRFVPNDAYFKILSNLTAVMESLNYREELSKKGMTIHIFSEGKPADFGDIQKLPGVVFHLNEDLFETLHNLALADIFVGSVSGFSSFAKKIARGITIFPFTKPGNGVQIHLKRAIFEVEEFIKEWKERKRELRELPECKR